MQNVKVIRRSLSSRLVFEFDVCIDASFLFGWLCEFPFPKFSQVVLPVFKNFLHEALMIV